MIRITIIVVSIFELVCSFAVAQEIHEWKSSTGHTTKAAFMKLDETSRKVTLLIPREIDFSNLDSESLKLARKLASSQDSGASVESNLRPANEIKFLRDKYEQLIGFKSTREFSEWGFTIAGPFNQWMKDVMRARHQTKFKSEDVSFAIAHLLTLGLEYNSSKGEETEYTTFANDCIKGILNGESKNEYELRAIENLDSIFKAKESSSRASGSAKDIPQSSTDEFKYVQDDLYPDIYAFRTSEQLIHWWELPKRNPNLTDSERTQLGIELIESGTRIRIVSEKPYKSKIIYEVEPTTGRQKGKRFFVSSFDVYDKLR